MRKITAILLLIIIMVSLTSCYDANEIDNVLHVAAIGVDQGISDKWRLTLQFSTTKESGGGGGGESQSGGGASKGEYTFVTIDAPSFFTGINMLDASLPRRLSFIHAQTIIFSEELAKSGLIGEYIAPISRFREIRRSSHVLVIKGKASEFLEENQPFIGNMLSKNFQIMIGESENTGFFPHVTLEHFYTWLKSSNSQPIATLAAVNDFGAFKKEGEPWGTQFNTGGNYTAGELPRTGENKIELFGTALFDGDTMVGELNGDETRYMLMVRGEFKRGFFTMQDPKKPEVIIPLDVKSAAKPEIKVTFADIKPVIHVKVGLDADILAVQSGINYEKPELKSLLEETFTQSIVEGINKVIEKCQGLNTDVFLFGDHASRSFLTIDELEDYNWNSRFKDAEITVEVEFAIRRTGTQIDNHTINDSEGAE
jgi:spore germination protein KC